MASPLKPAAIPLLDSGKALARGGELLIDATNTLGIYGGGISSSGAGIRNAGDCIAQAAASCRFKTGYELVLDELREGATCLDEAHTSINRALKNDEMEELNDGFMDLFQSSAAYLKKSSIALEAAGAGIMQRLPVTQIGERIHESGEELVQLSYSISSISGLLEDSTENEDVQSCNTLKLCSEKILNAGEKMKIAGNNLSGVQVDKPKGKSWLKGGL